MPAGRGGAARGWRLAVLVGLLTTPGAWAAEALAPGPVVDRVVAVVEGQVLTLSELDFEARLALVERGGVEAAERPLGEETLRRALELAVSQRLQVMEAERLQAFAPDGAQLAARLERLRARFPDPEAYQAFLRRHDADEEMVGAVLARALRAERVLDSRVRLRAQVSEAEVRAAYEAQKAQLDAPYAAVRAALRERLVRARYAELAAAELARVRAGAHVKWVAPFAREGRP